MAEQPVCFEWREQGAHPHSVEVCGSFTQWQNRIPLVYDEGKHLWRSEKPVSLPIGTHSYKFIIDKSNWCVAPDVPTTLDSSGNINNQVVVKDSRPTSLTGMGPALAAAAAGIGDLPSTTGVCMPAAIRPFGSTAFAPEPGHQTAAAKAHEKPPVAPSSHGASAAPPSKNNKHGRHRSRSGNKSGSASPAQSPAAAPPPEEASPSAFNSAVDVEYSMIVPRPTPGAATTRELRDQMQQHIEHELLAYWHSIDEDRDRIMKMEENFRKRSEEAREADYVRFFHLSSSMNVLFEKRRAKTQHLRDVVDNIIQRYYAADVNHLTMDILPPDEAEDLHLEVIGV